VDATKKMFNSPLKIDFFFNIFLILQMSIVYHSIYMTEHIYIYIQRTIKKKNMLERLENWFLECSI